jgi:hypothetical protein
MHSGNVTIDTTRLVQRLAALPGQVGYATALMLTHLAKDAQGAAHARIEQAFDKPTRFTQTAIAIKPATKAKLTSVVFAKDIQADYLAIQETGGERRPRPGAPVIVPVQIRVNAHGNIPRGKLRREVAKPTTFVSGQDTSRTRHLPAGIYQRFKQGRGKTARPPRLLVALEKVARYRPRFRFQQTVREAVEANIDRRWREAIQRTLATLRR